MCTMVRGRMSLSASLPVITTPSNFFFELMIVPEKNSAV